MKTEKTVKQVIIHSISVGKEFETNNAVLLIAPSLEYNKVALEIAQQLSGKRVIYVTLNKTGASLKELFAGKKIKTDRFVFVDGISKSIKKVGKEARVVFVESPGALIELSLAIMRLAKQGFEFAVFDSLSNLEIYKEQHAIVRFASSLVNQLRENKTKSIFYAVGTKEQESLIQECSVFFDDAIDLSKT